MFSCLPNSNSMAPSMPATMVANRYSVDVSNDMGSPERV